MNELEYVRDLTHLPDGSAEASAFLIGTPKLGLRLKVPKSAFVFDETRQAPSQKEVDSVAAFVEAAEELEREPFFGPDEKRSFTSSGKHQTFHLGDRFHFRSALISFRRIWMDGETSNFYKVYGILWRHAESINDRMPLLWSRGFIHQTESNPVRYPLEGV